MSETLVGYIPRAGQRVGITRTDGTYVAGVVNAVRGGHIRLATGAVTPRFVALADVAAVDTCPAGCPECPR